MGISKVAGLAHFSSDRQRNSVPFLPAVGSEETPWKFSVESNAVFQ
jgi:hypothetical protein